MAAYLLFLACLLTVVWLVGAVYLAMVNENLEASPRQTVGEMVFWPALVAWDLARCVWRNSW